MSFIKGFQRTAIFISGTGSCLQSLLEQLEVQNTTVVVTNKKNVFGVIKARRFGIQVYDTGLTIDFQKLNHFLKAKKIEKIILAGFMKILPLDFLSHWSGQIYNIHPSLLPKYKGLNAFRKSFESRDAMGVTIHHVIPAMDDGKVILQKKSLSYSDQIDDQASEYFLRRTEQHLLREFSQKELLKCIKF